MKKKAAMPQNVCMSILYLLLKIIHQLEKPLKKPMSRIVDFFKSKTAPGILLCLAAVLAMVIENSPFYEYYDLFKNIPVVLQAGTFVIDKPLLLWINDGLMAVFFLLIGLEIKREILQGHLSTK